MKRWLGFCLTALLLTGCGPSDSTQTLTARMEETPVAFALTLEGRPYAQAWDGSSARLLTDGQVQAIDQRGNLALLALTDHTVRRVDLVTGEMTLLLTLEKTPAYLLLCDSGIVYGYADFLEGVELWYWANGESTLLACGGDISSPWVVGDNLLYQFYDTEKECPVLVSMDLPTQTELWRKDDWNGQLYETEQETVAYSTSWLWEGDDFLRSWERLDLQTGESETVELPMSYETDGLICAGSGGYLIEKDWGNDGYWFVKPSGEATQLELPLDESGGEYLGLYPMERDGDLVLLRSYLQKDTELLGEDYYYSILSYYVFDAATGTLTPLESRGEYASLFAEGEFPLLDSSTARKPVTKDIYSFFCLENGIEGNAPVCNTTHLAWLALADRETDIALLAAPTPEEEAYLAERGVSIEKKLYGGDGLVFIGGKACGVTDLSLDEVRAIYRGEITNWAELGGADHPIHVLYREEQSGSQRLFETMLWKDEGVPDFAELGFEVMDGMSTIVNECLYDPYTIGYSIMTYLDEVYAEAEVQCFCLNGASATAEHVADGSYPLGTKGYVVIRSDEAENSPARRLYDWFGSSCADALLWRNSVTPLHEA